MLDLPDYELVLIVSILVLMEVKRELCLSIFSAISFCFNPCFDGSEARVAGGAELCLGNRSFNPCFDGSEARECVLAYGIVINLAVSILVLMEVKREQAETLESVREYRFQSLF